VSKKSIVQLAVIIFTVFLSLKPGMVRASGFAIFVQDASSQGQANSVISHTEGPASIFFNPSLLPKLDETQASIGTTVVIPRTTFRSSASGDEFKTRNAVFYPSHFFLAHKHNEHVSTGLGVFSPFGLGKNWGDTWEGRYIVTQTNLQSLDIRPVAASRLNQNISVSAGLDVLFLDASIESKVPSSAGDINQKFSGDGTGYGYNFGLLYEPNAHIALGVSYRSGVSVDVDGKVEFDPAVAGSDGRVKIKLPEQVHAGISYKGFENLIFEAGMRWEGWSSYDELKIEFDQPVFGNNSATYSKKWKDTYTYNIVGRYKVNNRLSLLAGYSYGGNAVPDETFEPTIPDSRAQILSFGADLDYTKFKFAFAYSYQSMESRRKNNAVPGAISSSGAKANGEYKTTTHLVGLTFGYRF
jgi:long-chain fatty acid transport protein